MHLPQIQTGRLTLSQLTPALGQQLADYRQRNRRHLAPWEPLRCEDFYSLAGALDTAGTAQAQFLAGNGVYFVAQLQGSDEIIGTCNFSNIIGGPFQACYLGYGLGEPWLGRGLASEMVTAGLEYVFGELKLHRVMANYMPRNHSSARLLARLGFEKEGLARDYLKIAGHWEDHVLTAKLSPYGAA